MRVSVEITEIRVRIVFMHCENEKLYLLPVPVVQNVLKKTR